MKFHGREVSVVNNNVYDCSGHCLGIHHYSKTSGIHYVLGNRNIIKGTLDD